MTTKTITFIWAFVLAVTLFSCNSQPQTTTDSEAPAAVPTEESAVSLDCLWELEQVQLDSVTNCNMPDGRTRYFSHYFLHLSLEYTDQLAGDTLALKFKMEAEMPGQQCANGLPMAIKAVDDAGEELDAAIFEMACSRRKEASTKQCVEVRIDLPLRTGATASKGGLCIILETIDPLSMYVPRLVGLSEWTGHIADNAYTIVPQKTNGVNAGLQISSPGKPDCTACEYD